MSEEPVTHDMRLATVERDWAIFAQINQSGYSTQASTLKITRIQWEKLGAPIYLAVGIAAVKQ